MTKQNYIKYRNQWYNTASLDVIIKHITRGIKVIDVTEVKQVTEEVTEPVNSGNMVTDYN